MNELVDVSIDQVNVPWYYIVIAIAVCAALIEHGLTMMFSKWERELKGPQWLDVVGSVGGLVLASIVGGLVGMVIWNGVLGAVVGFSGACGSSLIMTMVRARLGLGKKSLKEDE
jgi:hypothetical protein